MLPTIALVGRPNVGKSTLFNRLTKTRNALVADFPGLTRDRHYGRARAGEREFLVVDTGGFEPVATSGILFEMAKQAKAAIAESDAIVFIVDARDGPRAAGSRDRRAAAQIGPAGRARRQQGRRPAARAHRRRIPRARPRRAAADLGRARRERARPDRHRARAVPAPRDDGRRRRGRRGERRIRVAVVGRPNVGKSTLVNALLGEERVIAFDEPGTTRDAIYLDFERGERRYTLIDTAGVRRRGKVSETVEKFSVIKTLQAIEDAQRRRPAARRASTASPSRTRTSPATSSKPGARSSSAINKWDAADAEQRATIKRELERKLGFLAFAAAALHLGARRPRRRRAAARRWTTPTPRRWRKLPTPRLTRDAAARRRSASSRRAPAYVRPKLRYAHQGGMNPPLVIIHGIGAVARARRLPALPGTFFHATRSNCGARPLGYNSRQASTPTRIPPHAASRSSSTRPARARKPHAGRDRKDAE